jgi:hypothetical protein
VRIAAPAGKTIARPGKGIDSLESAFGGEAALTPRAVGLLKGEDIKKTRRSKTAPPECEKNAAGGRKNRSTTETGRRLSDPHLITELAPGHPDVPTVPRAVACFQRRGLENIVKLTILSSN